MIKSARGILQDKPGVKPFDQRWADYKKEEKALEEAKFARLQSRQTCVSANAAGGDL